MKKTIVVPNGKTDVEREVNYIPFRYIIAILFVIAETAAIIAGVVLLTMFFPYSYISVVVTQIGVAISIIGRNDNPDYKLPWIFFVLLIPIIGFMLYFMFYSRKLSKKQRKRIKRFMSERVDKDDTTELETIKNTDTAVASQAHALKVLSDSHVYANTDIKYYPLGEHLFAAMVEELKKAEKFIFMEYFIIEEGHFWNTILEVLQEKIKAGVEVRVVYDDIGCMTTLAGNYYKKMKKLGIKCVPFSKLRGQANNEFNNRSHRKITVIDGKVGFTGGVNIADEYINRVVRFGHWKDVGIRLEGEAVNELTRLFLIDYGMNDKKFNDDFTRFYAPSEVQAKGYCIPFGDGPRPIYERRVAKTAIQNLLNSAQKSVYITTPYLIIDNELAQTLENTALRGVDVRIITPHIPDKKLVFSMTRSYYKRLLDAGVSIYEYESGFVHAKMYIADGKVAIIGTVNLDYRSLVHHFENGVWMYDCPAIADMEADFIETQNMSIKFSNGMLKETLWKRFIRALVKVFAPLL
ncbi:MAG: cardiolipin synthase [Clostridiales bacterium]|nr:cardiolipin synthase [Clostridiales bacterium]